MAQNDFRTTVDKGHLISQMFYMLEQGDRKGLETAHQKLMDSCFGQHGISDATADVINKLCQNKDFQDPETHSGITIADQFLTAFLRQKTDRGYETPVVNACLKSAKVQEAIGSSWDIEFATYAVRIDPYHAGASTAHDRLAQQKFGDVTMTEVLQNDAIKHLSMRARILPKMEPIPSYE